MKKMKKFLKRLIIILIIVIIIAVIIITIVLISKHNKKTSPSNIHVNSAGEKGIVTIYGEKIGIFKDKDDANLNPVTITASNNIPMKVKGNYPNVTANSSDVLKDENNGNYKLNLNDTPDDTKILFEVSIGGDGSILGKRFKNGIDTFYFVVVVTNSNVSQSPTNISPTTTTEEDTTGIPTGTVYFDDAEFKTYGSEWEAQQAIEGQKNKFTIPSRMAKNLKLTAVPEPNTARIWVSVCLVDDEDADCKEVRLNADSDWSATMNLEEFAGHQVTLVLHAEDASALGHGYSYVSFYLP